MGETKHYGNLQRIINGKRRFAITPHIPGGFTTPQTLIKIAEVAQKYKGVVKITSGQRIMITNLKEEDLDSIWKELGMEPAVKSQYSVKNVEMCPSNYCKRRKQDSIGLGMKISKKYHGSPMPNRTKIGVSGCRNACGSVYSKDLGVIGDIDGYRITAGGSSGFYPRVADVIITGLNEEEALKQVDCIFEYYNTNAEIGEKMSDFIERIGLEKFKKDTMIKDV